MSDLVLTEEPKEHTISFHPGKEMAWVMKIQNKDGKVEVLFNREVYPTSLPNDFAEAVAMILCKPGFLDKFYKERNTNE